MDYSNTIISFLQEDCSAEFGHEKGAAIYAKACKRLSAMLENADYRNSESIKMHITQVIYPTIAYYLTLKDDGYSKGEALELVLKETQKAALIQKKRNEPLGRMPFAYALFKRSVKGFMTKMYPNEGWETEWVRLDKDEIHINFRRCIYLELTEQFECPELCTVFCQNDITTFAGYEPKIRFARNGTMAEGAACCDFHFTRGK